MYLNSNGHKTPAASNWINSTLPEKDQGVHGQNVMKEKNTKEIGQLNKANHRTREVICICLLCHLAIFGQINNQRWKIDVLQEYKVMQILTYGGKKIKV